MGAGLRRIQRRDARRGQFVGPAHDDLAEQRLLPAAMVVDEAHRLARRRRDVPHPRAVEVVAGEDRFRHFKYARSGHQRSPRRRALALQRRNSGIGLPYLDRMFNFGA